MLTRLIDAGTPRPVLVGGLIWAVWHLPLIFAGVYAAGSNRMLSAVLFVGSVVSISFVFSRMRLETGSVWPVVYAHATWNAIIQGPFDGDSTGTDAALWTGESGILVVVALPRSPRSPREGDGPTSAVCRGLACRSHGSSRRRRRGRPRTEVG